MKLERVKTLSATLSPWAHLATVGRDGDPDVVPIHPGWEGAELWFMARARSVKVRNIAHHANVALHWQVTEAGDGLEVWGRATIHDDVQTKRRLWNGVLDYDLNHFAPGGPDRSPDVVFVAIRPVRALYLQAFGTKGRETWAA